jgi:hypothetical protein
VAASRKHNNEGAIFVLNLLLGWTFLGWVIALIWAPTDNTKDSEKRRRAADWVRALPPA